MVKGINEVLAFHQEALKLRAYRQQILASNISNADTPHYKAKDFNFSEALSRALDGAEKSNTVNLQITSSRHIDATVNSGGNVQLLYRLPIQDSIDGNTVDLDLERNHFADNAIHYEANLIFINNEIKAMLAAIQG